MQVRGWVEVKEVVEFVEECGEAGAGRDISCRSSMRRIGDIQ